MVNTMFFIDKNFRRKGVSVEILKGVIAYAKESLPDSFAWIGLYKSFDRAGKQTNGQILHRQSIKINYNK